MTGHGPGEKPDVYINFVQEKEKITKIQQGGLVIRPEAGMDLNATQKVLSHPYDFFF